MSRQSSITRAGPEDDAALQELLRETPLPGWIPASLEREPSFFSGTVDALHHDVALVRRDGRAAACGSRLLRRAWWKGATTDTAYLADLRIHPEWQLRSGHLLAGGFQFFETCAAIKPAAVTWTAIFENNLPARAVLTGSRAGLPAYTDRGRLLCPAFPLSQRAAIPHVAGIRWETGTPGDFPEITAFLTARQQHRPLAPVHTSEDFAAGRRWPGLRAEDFLLARRGNRLAGVVAVWDQRAFRQVHIRRISGVLRLVRGLGNPLAKLSGRAGIPRDHSILSLAHASFLAVEEDCPALARALILAARVTAVRRGLEWLCVCLHEADPLVPALRGLLALPSHGRLYQVSRTPPSWPAGTAPVIESSSL